MLAGWISCLLITALDFYGLPDALGKAWAARGRKARIVRTGTQVDLTDGPELP